MDKSEKFWSKAAPKRDFVKVVERPIKEAAIITTERVVNEPLVEKITETGVKIAKESFFKTKLGLATAVGATLITGGLIGFFLGKKKTSTKDSSCEETEEDNE